MIIGVLALQGDFREHIQAIAACGHEAQEVRRVSELDQCQALILPGGESTTIALLARNYGLIEPLRKRTGEGMPTYGSCAGMILLADRILDGVAGQETFGGIDMTVRRNAFGRQIDSFETDLKFKGITDPAIRAIFIRAPWVESIGKEVEVLAQITDEAGKTHPVAVRQGRLLATSFHPELTGDSRIHKYFVEQICSELVRG